jgi:hypothetical protein
VATPGRRVSAASSAPGMPPARPSARWRGVAPAQPPPLTGPRRGCLPGPGAATLGTCVRGRRRHRGEGAWAGARPRHVGAGPRWCLQQNPAPCLHRGDRPMAHLLIVEDDAITALALQHAVTQMGHQVVARTASAAAAMAAVQGYRPGCRPPGSWPRGGAGRRDSGDGYPNPVGDARHLPIGVRPGPAGSAGVPRGALLCARQTA